MTIQGGKTSPWGEVFFEGFSIDNVFSPKNLSILGRKPYRMLLTRQPMHNIENKLHIIFCFRMVKPHRVFVFT